MQPRKVIVISIVYLILINTAYFWQKLPGLFDIFFFTGLAVSFILLVFVLCVQAVHIFFEHMKNKQRLLSTSILIVVLLLVFLFPTGMINFKSFEAPDVLTAQYEGVANCTATLHLKAENKFVYTSVCFAIDEYDGIYHIEGDTIKLKFNKSPHADVKGVFAVMQREPGSEEIIWYHSLAKGKKPLPMKIIFKQ